MTPEEELALVEAAIRKTLEAQRYKTGNTSVERADLATLYKRRNQLKAEIDEQSTGGVDYAVFDRR